MDGQTASTSTFIESQQHIEQEEDYPLHLIISRMMFTYGDSDDPLCICQEFMLTLLHEQLKMLVDKAYKLSLERHSPSIGFPEFMFAFRRHPLLIQKLIGYMRLLDLMPSALRPFDSHGQAVANSDCALPLIDPSLFVGQKPMEEEDSQKFKNTSKVIAAIRLIDVLGHLLDATDEHSLNVAKMERMRLMETRTRQMSAEQYKNFAEARRTSLCSWMGRRSASSAAKFLRWIGAPPMAERVVDALNFCATEIVAIVTESAVLCREEENGQQKEGKGVVEDVPSQRLLSIRHYEEAVRRNRGYAKRRDILFGYF